MLRPTEDWIIQWIKKINVYLPSFIARTTVNRCQSSVVDFEPDYVTQQGQGENQKDSILEGKCALSMKYFDGKREVVRRKAPATACQWLL